MPVSKELDLIDKVHSHLKNLDIDYKGTRDENISNMATVNKKVENVCMEHLHFPYYELDNLASISEINSYQSLISLLLYDDRFKSFLSMKKLMEVAPKKLPRSKFYIFLWVDEYLTSEDTEYNILAYFFTNVEQRSRIDVAWMSSDDHTPLHFATMPSDSGVFIDKRDENHVDMECDRIVEELGIKNCKYGNSTILLLPSDSIVARDCHRIIRKLYKSAPDGHEISWMCLSEIDLMITCSDSKKDDKYWHLMALRISGPGVKSWNTKFFVNEDRGDITRKLHELKKKVTRKQRCIGLINSSICKDPKCNHELHPYAVGHDLMQFVQLAFPDIPFVGLFKKPFGKIHDSSVEKRRSILGDANDLFKPNDGVGRGGDLELITTVMIISYD